MDEYLHTLDKKLEESLNFDRELGEFLGVFNVDLRAFVERDFESLDWE